jgi:cell division protein FtsL
MSDISRLRGSEAPWRAPVPAARPVRPPLRAVPPRQRRRRTFAAIWLAGIVVFGLLLSLVVAQTTLMRNQARIDRLDKDVADAKQFHQRAQLRVDQLEAPQSIEAEALKRGLVRPTQPIYLTPSPQAVRDAIDAQQQAVSGAP